MATAQGYKRVCLGDGRPRALAIPASARRSELLGQLRRLQDLYVLGDLPKAQYVMRRQAIEEELQRLGAPADPGIEQAKDMLADFSRF
jgi:hypothetical protein